MPFRMSWGNIAGMRADVIVNAAYPTLRGGSDGVHGEIFTAAGREALEAALAGIGWCDVGDAVVTPGFGLRARHIIHAVGPQWRGGKAGERELLARAYRRALALAEELSARSVALPLLSAGSFGFPTAVALDVAVAEIGAFLREHGEMDIELVLDERWPRELPDPLHGRLTWALRERYAQDAPELPLRPVGAQRRDAVSAARPDPPPMSDAVSGIWPDGDIETQLWQLFQKEEAQKSQKHKKAEAVLDALDRGYVAVAKAISWPFRMLGLGLRAFWRWVVAPARRRKPPLGARGAAGDGARRDAPPPEGEHAARMAPPQAGYAARSALPPESDLTERPQFHTAALIRPTAPDERPAGECPAAKDTHMLFGDVFASDESEADGARPAEAFDSGEDAASRCSRGAPDREALPPASPLPRSPMPQRGGAREQPADAEPMARATGQDAVRRAMETLAQRRRTANETYEGLVDRDMLRAHRALEADEPAPARERAAERGVADAARARTLKEAVAHLGDTFSQAVLTRIDWLGLRDVDVYRRANLDRKLFSKLRSDPRYQPSKQTAVALCEALELNLDDALDLLARAGYTLAACNKADLIAAYFIEHGIYDVFQLNEALFAFDQPCLGA